MQSNTRLAENDCGETSDNEPTQRCLTPSYYRVLRSHRAAAVNLPAPDVKWATNTDGRADNELEEVGPELADAVRRFTAHGIINDCGRVVPGDGRRIYQTDRAAYNFAERVLTNVRTAPCGHSGVRNLGGNEYTCTHDACDARFGRTVAEEVLSG